MNTRADLNKYFKRRMRESSWLALSISTTFVIGASAFSGPHRCNIHYNPNPPITRDQRLKKVRSSSPLRKSRIGSGDDITMPETLTTGEAVGFDDDSISPNTLELVDKHVDKERTLGVLILLTVPLAWGTYTPVVKYMYDRMDPPVPGFAFSAGYYLVAASVLGALSWWRDYRETSGEDDVKGNAFAALGGLELGSYLFIGNGCQVIGLQSVPADRAAFLVQLTTVMVPILSALVEGRGLFAIPALTWVACGIAFLGVVVMGADGDHALQIVDSGQVGMLQNLSSMQLSQGDLLIVLAAMAYTMHVVRLGMYAPRVDSLKLAASKARTEAWLSAALVAVLVYSGQVHGSDREVFLPEFVQEMGVVMVNYFEAIKSSFADNNDMATMKEINQSSKLLIPIAAILWTGLITCAYTIYAQSFGQRRVNPIDSNLIYTTQPLFSSLFAYGMLGEKLGVWGWTGAALIGVALGLVVFEFNDDS